jgi:hypothetical protein
MKFSDDAVMSLRSSPLTGCSFPIGEGAAAHWCNAPKVPGRSYCEEHERLAHTETPPAPKYSRAKHDWRIASV